MYGFDDVQRGNYFGEDTIRRTKVEVRVESLRMESLHVRMRSQERR